MDVFCRYGDVRFLFDGTWVRPDDTSVGICVPSPTLIRLG